MLQAEGVYNQRLQNLALTLDKVIDICYQLSIFCHALLLGHFDSSEMICKRWKQLEDWQIFTLLGSFTGEVCDETCLW